MTITIVLGPPAAGKSTFVKENAAEGDVVVDFDAIATAFGSGHPHEAPPAIRDVAHVARDAAIAHILAGVESPSWIIHSNPTEEQLQKYADAGAETVVVDPGMEAVLEQARNDNRPEWTEEAIRAWYSDKVLSDKAIRKGGKMPAVMKTFAAQVAPTTEGGDPAGTFEAIVSVFGNPDRQGDIVQAGAFAQSIQEWVASGRPIPVMWSHQFDNPDSILGYYSQAEETEKGLRLKGHLDLGHPPAARIWELMKSGLITEFSWSGEVLEYSIIEPEDEDEFWYSMNITKVDLWEAGPCFKGVNPATELISVKSSDLTGPLGPRIKAATGAFREGHKVTQDQPTTDNLGDGKEVRQSAATKQVRAILDLLTI